MSPTAFAEMLPVSLGKTTQFIESKIRRDPRDRRRGANFAAQFRAAVARSPPMVNTRAVGGMSSSTLGRALALPAELLSQSAATPRLWRGRPTRIYVRFAQPCDQALIGQGYTLA